MRYRKLGNTDVKLSAIGLGCMGMSFAYGATDEAENLKVLNHSLELGINFWDTADMYANGANEVLLSKVLAPNRDKIFLATKFGFRFKNGTPGTSGDPSVYFDGSPAWIKQAVELSLKRLNIETIDLYYAHRVDPNVPIEDTVGAMADLVHAGKIRYIGLSEANAETIRKAHAVYPITALQTEYSLLSRDVETTILPTLGELGIAFVPYSPLARGLFGIIHHTGQLEKNDFRSTLPRFQAEHLDNNKKLATALQAMAAEKGLTGTQLALAWVLAQGEDIIPIPGTKRLKYLEENVAAASIALSKEELSAIEQLLKTYPNIGPRYSKREMSLIN